MSTKENPEAVGTRVKISPAQRRVLKAAAARPDGVVEISGDRKARAGHSRTVEALARQALVRRLDRETVNEGPPQSTSAEALTWRITAAGLRAFDAPDAILPDQSGGGPEHAQLEGRSNPDRSEAGELGRGRSGGTGTGQQRELGDEAGAGVPRPESAEAAPGENLGAAATPFETAASPIPDDQRREEAIVGGSTIELRLRQERGPGEGGDERGFEVSCTADEMQPKQAAAGTALHVPWTAPTSRRRRDMILPDVSDRPQTGRPMRDGVRDNILRAMVRGRCWLDDIVAGRVTDLGTLASQADLTERSIRFALNLAFMSPWIIRAIVDGTLPRGISLARIADLPLDWREQHRALGIPPIGHADAA